MSKFECPLRAKGMFRAYCKRKQEMGVEDDCENPTADCRWYLHRDYPQQRGDKYNVVGDY